jgi:hypothetical protein
MKPAVPPPAEALEAFADHAIKLIGVNRRSLSGIAMERCLLMGMGFVFQQLQNRDYAGMNALEEAIKVSAQQLARRFKGINDSMAATRPGGN